MLDAGCSISSPTSRIDKGHIMPKFGFQVPHELTQQEARSRLERFAEMLEEKFKGQVSDLEQSWEDDTLRFRFKTYGIQINGGIAVTDKALDFAGELPFAAMMFKGKIESEFREQLERLVAT
jgi:hypothetical protein